MDYYKKTYRILVFILLFICACPLFAQNKDININSGNQDVRILLDENNQPTENINKNPQKTGGQISVTPISGSSYTPQSLVQNVLVSGCLVASNVTYSGNINALGLFNSNGTNFAIDSGIIISTGNVSNAVGPNQFTDVTTQFTSPGNADLNIITGANSTKDAAVLEFDFIPASNTVEFRYILASEEYPEWACGTFNDVFAFLLSGPGISGTQGFSNNAVNIALLPNNITPVTINNIHVGGWNQGANETSHDPLTCPDINAQYYTDHQGSTTIEYDGSTTILTARWTVIPCQTYHIKLAIADVADRKYDSGVFIEGKSFTSNPVSMLNQTANGVSVNEVTEGCNYIFEFVRNNSSNNDTLVIYYNLTGTSSTGDHTFPADSVIIPAGQNSISVPYSVIADAISEGAETLTIAIGNGCPCSANAIQKTIVLFDELILNSVHNDISCFGMNDGTITANVTGGSGNYTYSINNSPYQSSNTFAGLAPGTYIISVHDSSSCYQVYDTINIIEPDSVEIMINSLANANCYNTATGSVIVSATGGTGVYQFSVNGGSPQLSGAFSGLNAGSYTFVVTDANGCSDTISAIITQPSLLVADIIFSNDASCNRFFDGLAVVSASGGTPGYTYLWSNGVTTDSNNYLSADTYFVTVTDSNGCISTDSIVINEPTNLVISIVAKGNVSCNGNNDGFAIVNALGGTPPYTYLWSNGVSGPSISNLAAGTYTVTVTDAHGCLASLNIIITQPTLIVPTTGIIDNILCHGGSGASAYVTSSGGFPGYTYIWSTGSTNDTINNLTAGIYSVTITDSHNCSVTTTVTVSEPPLLQVNVNAQNILCYGQTNGSATAIVTGGTPNYSYNWSNGSTNPQINNLGAGTYTITVNDINGCTASNSVIINEPVLLTTTMTPPTNVNCYAASNGSVTVIANGGTSPYIYNWSNGSTNANASGLNSGWYYVTVTDNNGCIAIDSVEIIQPPQLLTLISNVNHILCNGGNNGSVTISATGGTPAYTFNWSNGSTATTLNNLTAGTYTVTVTDNNGCTATNSVAINQPATINVSLNVQNISCYSGNNGSVTAIVSGGTPAYSYLWSNGSTTNNINNLSAGSYFVTVTDINGCSATASCTLTQPTQLTTLITQTTNVSCNAGNNGSATITPTGGTPVYSYNWSNGNTGSTASGLASGTYFVTVTDANGCTATNSVVINQPIVLNSNIISSTNISCFNGNNGSATISASGGTPGYTYNWSNNSNGATITNLTAGTYTVTITDNNGCTATNSVTINQPNQLTVNKTKQNVSCFGGSNGWANAYANGGTPPYNFVWSNGTNSNLVTNLPVGTYYVTVTDANGCSASTSVSITQPNQLTSTINSVNNVNCYGGNTGSATIIPSGGTAPYSYIWSSGSTTATASGLTAGTYYVTVTDSKGCTTTNSVTINQNTQINTSFSNVTNVSCNGGNNGTATINVSGGVSPYSYLWSNGSSGVTANNLSAGTYFVTVTDSNNCNVIAQVNINQTTTLSLITNSTSGTTCFGSSDGSAQVSAIGGTPGYSYIWNTGTPGNSISNVTAGQYQVSVTDINGCSASATVTISQPAQIDPIASSTNVNCYGGNNGTATINPIGGTPPYSVLWSTGSNLTSISNLSPGTYWVIVTDINGCTGTDTINIIQPPLLINISMNSSDISCYGASDGLAEVIVSGNTGPYSYIWSNNQNTGNIDSLHAGLYSVTVTDAFGCVISGNVTINEPALLATTTSVISDVSCFAGNDGSATVNVAGGTTPYQYLWSDGSSTQQISQLIAGNYFITVTDANGCISVNNVIITEPQVLNGSINAVSNVSCNGGNNGTASVVCNGGTLPYSYLWSNGVTTNQVQNLPAGNHQVTVTDYNGCSTVLNVTITEPPQLLINLAGITNVSCFNGNNGSIDISVSGGVSPYSFIWSDGSQTEDLSGLVFGNYTVTVSDLNGCSQIANYNIQQPAQSIFVAINSNNVMCSGGNNGSAIANVSGSSGPYSYLWSNGANTPSIQNLVAGIYTITVTDAAGCTMTSSVTLTEPNVLALNISSTNVSCNGGNNATASISVTGGSLPYSFLWSNGGTNAAITSIAAGNYSVTVTDFNGCSTSASTIISQPSALNYQLTANDVLCFGGNTGSASLTVNGGTSPYSYLWSNNNVGNTAGNLISGNYSFTITDANLCIVSGSVLINEPALLTSQIDTSSNATCFGYNNGTALVSANGGTQPYSYLWNPTGETTAFNEHLGAGQHQVIVTDSHGCISVNNVVITQPSEVIINTYGSGYLCEGNLANIGASASGGTAPYTYTWNPSAGNTNTQTILVTDSATYYVFATDTNGCVSDTGVIVIEMAPRLKAGMNSDDHICIGESTTLNVVVTGGIPPYHYEWSNGFGNLPGPFVVSPANTTTYVVTVFDACNSVPSVVTFTVEVHPMPVASISSFNLKGCGSLEATFSDNNYLPNNSYVWDFGDPQSGSSNHSTAINPIHFYDEVGVYDVRLTVTSEWGCTAEFLYPQLVAVYDKPNASFITDKVSISIEDPIIRCTDKSQDAVTWEWNFDDIESGSNNQSNDQNPIHKFITIGEHIISLYIENEQGCSDTNTQKIVVNDYFTFYAPNAFTPNGDGINDEFKVYTSGVSADGYAMMVYNRWGELVFETKDIDKGWNGMNKNGNNISPAGVYTWTAVIKDLEGKPYSYTGSVLIVN